MSDFDRDLKEQLTKHSDAHQAPYAWQEQVWRQLAKPPEKPWKAGFAYWPLVAIAGLMLLVGTAVMYQAQKAEDEQMKKAEIALSLRVQEFEREVALAQMEVQVMMEEVDRAFFALENAIDEKSREEARLAGIRARQALKNKQAKLEALRRDGIEKAKRKKKAKARKEKRLVNECAKSNDPLCGL